MIWYHVSPSLQTQWSRKPVRSSPGGGEGMTGLPSYFSQVASISGSVLVAMQGSCSSPGRPCR